MTNNPIDTEQEIFTVPCPTCKKDVAWTTENEYRPFCSKRCQLIDLGEWAAEEKAIPSQNPLDMVDLEMDESELMDLILKQKPEDWK